MSKNLTSSQFIFTLSGIDVSFFTNHSANNDNSNNNRQRMIPLSSTPQRDNTTNPIRKMGLSNTGGSNTNDHISHCYKPTTLPCEKFIDGLGNSYPEKTFIHCWWCVNPFNNQPMGLPIDLKYIDVENNVKACEFTMVGFFCSFECAKAYLLEHKQNALFKFKNSEELLDLLFFKVFKEKVKIKPAPDWRLLNIFSGDVNMDLMTFRQYNTPIVKTPFIYLKPAAHFLSI
jgi:hypothetical protein